MIQLKVKAINYLGSLETIEDIYNANIDVLVRLNDPFCEQDPDFSYSLEITTPSNLSYLMKKWGLSYFPPMGPYIVVENLTEKVIEEAVQAFVTEQDDAYWLKVYSLASILKIDELNQVIERQNKQQS